MRGALSVPLLMSVSEAFSVPFLTLIKPCYTQTYMCACANYNWYENTVSLFEGLLFLGIMTILCLRYYKSSSCLFVYSGKNKLIPHICVLRETHRVYPVAHPTFLLKIYISKCMRSMWELERRRTDAFELWCQRRLLRVLWTARRSNQSILKEISPGCSLEVYVPRFFVLSQQRFGATDIKALGASQLFGLGQTVLQLLGKSVLQLYFI